jgi:hypothetical protein
MVRTGTAFVVIQYNVRRRFVNTILRRIFRPKEGGRVSVMDPATEIVSVIENAMERYINCLRCEACYGEL